MKRHTSLQTLKADIAKKEAALKTLYSLYPELKGYSEAELLPYFELQTPEALYRYIQKHHALHPENIELSESPVCSCTDSKGYPKGLYETEASAQKERGQRDAKLSVYPCPSGCGWHLTKR